MERYLIFANMNSSSFVLEIIKSMIKSNILILITLVFNNLVAAAEQYEVLTEIYPPYQMYDESSQLTGLSVDLVKKLFKKAHLDYKIIVYPWPRANSIAQSKSNTFIFSISKIESRLEQFEWVVPLCNIEISLYKAKDRVDISIDQLSDAKAYLIGVEREQANGIYLESHGFKHGEHLLHVSNSKQLREMILVNRVDLIIASNANIATLIERGEEGAMNLIPEYSIKNFNKTLYLAANKNTNPTLIQKLKRAYSALSNSSQFSCNK